MDIASDKKPLLSSNSSQASGEGSIKDSKEESKLESKKDSKKDSKQEAPPSSGGGNTPPASGGATQKEKFVPNRVVRPTVQARPFSTRTKGVYWILTILHLIALLSVLFAISYGLLQFVFAQTRNGPLYWGQGSFIGGVPSIMYEPVKRGAIDKVRFGIKFNPHDNGSYKDYVERLKEVTKSKLTSQEEHIDRERCYEEGLIDHWQGSRKNGEKVCAQKSRTQLPGNGTNNVCDPESSLSFGYDTATPCLLIRLTKLLGFFPMSDEQEQKEEKPSGDSCKENIKFKCTAHANDANVTLLVPNGIPFCHFPFWNQKTYMPPFIMIRPEKPLPVGKTIIKCSPDMKSLKRLSNGNENKIEITIEIEEGEKKAGKTA